MFDDFGTDGHVEPTSQVQRQTQVVLDYLGRGYMIPVECRRHARSGDLDGDESSTTPYRTCREILWRSTLLRCRIRRGL